MRSQGEDIVAGLVKPAPVSESQRRQANIEQPSLQTTYPSIYKRIHDLATDLLKIWDIATGNWVYFESDKAEDLYILQTRDQDLMVESEANTFVCTPQEMKL